MLTIVPKLTEQLRARAARGCMGAALRRVAGWLTGDRLTIASAVAGALGIALVALAQDESFDWTRIIGALLVSASGSASACVLVSLSRCAGARSAGWPPGVSPSRCSSWSCWSLQWPVGLAALLAGAVDASGEEPGWLVALGTALGVVMLLGVLAGGWMAARSVIGAGGAAASNPHVALGDEDSTP